LWKFPPNKTENLASLASEVVSGMLTLGGWWWMEWRASKNKGGARVKPKSQLGRAVPAP